MQEYERYITVQEAAERLSRTEAEIWRMLETGALPAILRAELSSNDGTPIEYGFALLQPEDVARVVDQGGDDCMLEWKYCGGHGKAICKGARQSAIRVLWEPSTFPELMPQFKADAQAVADPATEADSPSTDTTPDSERRLARLRALGGDASLKQGEWRIRGIVALEASEQREGRSRRSQKTIRKDLIEAAESEREAKRANAFTGLGQR